MDINVIVNQDNVNPHFQHPEEFGLIVSEHIEKYA